MVYLRKIFKASLIIIFLFVLTDIFYVFFVPKILNSETITDKLQKTVESRTGYQLSIVNPQFKTYPNFNISFSSDKIIINTAGNTPVFNTDNFYIKINPVKFLFKTVCIRELSGISIYADLSPFKEDIIRLLSEELIYKIDL